MENIKDLALLENLGSITCDDLALAVGRWMLIDDALHVALLDRIADTLPDGAVWLRDGSVLASDVVDLGSILLEAVADVLEDVQVNYPGLAE